jgi:hypothetical protein
MADEPNPAEVAVSVNLDNTPILFTDNIFITTNEDGLVLDIGQKVGSSNQIRIVSRIGMSREHAKKLVQKLGELLVLSSGKSQTSDKPKN